MNQPGVIVLGLSDLALIYALVLLVVGLARLRGIGQERGLLIASLRMVVQLLAVGYVLHLLFALHSATAVLAVLLLMGAFAVQTVGSRVRERMPRFYRVVGLAMLVGCGGSTIVFCILVIGLTPWYDPRYLIPLAGMIIGNSMTGASLAAERLASEMGERREEIETALSLGAPARLAAREAVRGAFRAALIPPSTPCPPWAWSFFPG